MNRVLLALRKCLLICFAFLFIPLTASAYTQGDFTYGILSSNSAVITKYNGTAGGKITIPSTLGGYSVTSIGSLAFSSNTISEVVIPEGVKKIETWAFEYCKNLSAVTIPKSVTTIAGVAFIGCSNLKDIYYTGTTSQWAAIEKGTDWAKNCPCVVTCLGDVAPEPESLDYTLNSDGMYYSVTGIGTYTGSEITIPSTHNGKPVKEIGQAAFFYCKTIRSVIIPDGVTSIGARAFYACNNLVSVEIPDSVADIGEKAFLACKSLKSVVIPGSLDSIPDNAFQTCTALSELAIPEGVKTIGYAAFYECTGLQTITIPLSVTQIAGSAFEECTGVQTIYYAGTTAQWNTIYKESGWDYHCDYELICLGDPVPSEGLEYTLSNDGTHYIVSGIGSCTDVDVVISDTYEGLPVKEIGYSAFSGCRNILSVYIPENVIIIGQSAFAGCEALSKANIPQSVLAIADFAFAACSNLKEITLPEGITAINSGTFLGCGFSCVTIPNSVKAIAQEAFCACNNLTEVYIPANVTSIGSDAFAWCPNVTTYEVANDNQYYCNDFSGVLYDKNMSTLIVAPGKISGVYTIPDTVIDIKARAFWGCVGLTQLQIGSNVEKIGSEVFYWCHNLNQVMFTGNAPEFGSDAFYSVQATAYYPIYDPSWTAEVMQNYGGTITWVAYGQCDHSVTEWRMLDATNHELACSDCKSIIDTKEHIFTAIVTAPSMGVMGYTTYNCDICGYSFVGNENDIVDSGTCGDNVTWKLDIYGNLTISGTGAIETDSLSEIPWYPWDGNKNDIKNVVIELGVTSIGYYAFADCRSLTSVTIPQSITVIGHHAFAECRSLDSVNIPEGVTSIGRYAFYHCKLTEITIPKSVYDIDCETFIGCPFMTGIWVDSDNQYYSSDHTGVLFNKDKSMLIRVPEALSGEYVVFGGVTSIGDFAFADCDGLTSVIIPDSITSIGVDAFFDCNNLQYHNYDNCMYLGNDSNPYVALVELADAFCVSYEIHPNTRIIGDYAFSGCRSLTSISIPEGVTNIGRSAFKWCKSLSVVTIPESITNIGESAFFDCSSLTSVTYCGAEEQWNAINIDSWNTALIDAVRSYHDWKITSCTTPRTCTICGDTEGEAPGHSYIVTILVKPSFTACGQQQKVCSVCEDTVTETLDKLVGKVHQWNVALQDDYAVNFNLQISQSIENTAKVRLTVGDETVTYNISELKKTADGCFRLTANVSAAQMNDFITVMVMNGREIGSIDVYTVRQYCDTILAESKHSQYHALVKEMLHYGAMAQMYFDYDAENLANDGITGAAAADVPETAEEMTVNDKISGLSFYGASLVYRDRIAVRYYFTGDVTRCIFTANGNTYTPVAKDGMYYIEITDILPQNLDQQITLTVTDVKGNTLTVTYGPMNYIVRMNEKGSDTLKALVKALYNYHLAAKALTA